MISLDMIDQIVERTGVTYAQAKKALEENDEDVIKAIISIEEKNEKFGSKLKDDINIKKNDLMDTLKEILQKGNATKVIVEKNGEVYLSLPLTFAVPVGALSLAMGPILVAVVAVLGVGVYVGNFTVKVVKSDGSEVNVNEETEKKLKQLKKNAEKNEDESGDDVIDITETSKKEEQAENIIDLDDKDKE